MFFSHYVSAGNQIKTLPLEAPSILNSWAIFPAPLFGLFLLLLLPFKDKVFIAQGEGEPSGAVLEFVAIPFALVFRVLELHFMSHCVRL